MFDTLLSRENKFFRSVVMVLSVLIVAINIGWIFPAPNNFFGQLMSKLLPGLFGTKVTVQTTAVTTIDEPVTIWDPVSVPKP